MYNPTLFLKLESRDAFYKSCEDAGLVIDGEIAMSSHDYCMVAYHPLMHPTGGVLIGDDGNEYPEMYEVDGYHVNLIAKKEIGLEHLAIDVENPKFKFSGAE